MIYAGLNDKDKAFELNKAIDNRAGPIVFIRVDPPFENLRSDSRYKDLLKRMNLPECNFMKRCPECRRDYYDANSEFSTTTHASGVSCGA
jgi:hypothetical protein